MLWELYFTDRKQIPLLFLHARGAASWCPECHKTLQSVTAKCSVAPYGRMPSPVVLLSWFRRGACLHSLVLLNTVISSAVCETSESKDIILLKSKDTEGGVCLELKTPPSQLLSDSDGCCISFSLESYFTSHTGLL